MANNNNNNKNNNVEVSKMNKGNVMMNGGMSADELQAMFNEFMEGGITLQTKPEVGSYKAVWNGLDVDAKTMTWTLKFSIAGEDFEYALALPKKANQIKKCLKDIAFQLGMPGNKVAFADYNNYIGKEITVHVVTLEGYKNVRFWNFGEAIEETSGTPTEISDGKDF